MSKVIPIVRGEQFYLPPRSLKADAWDTMPVAERAFAWLELMQQRRIVRPEGVVLGEQYYARINHGRWIADCLCGSALVVSPDDPRYACPECGYGWIKLVFPDDVDAVEDELLSLAPPARNWWHDDDPANPERPQPSAAELILGG
ncbi:hypothetical protein [Streptomyces sp. NBC_00829]|uniref:hypothetical protein n=1 Tax=Streptomyces sp. NBC_00829 TaxID=2903679 RepID=UPI00386DEF4E|nr:hypothetical protein OG293_23100 [Streptomyces sp. NBC_00829]